jgi:hypothetical protein
VPLYEIQLPQRTGVWDLCTPGSDHTNIVGQDSSLGTETHYRLDGPGIESRWGRHFPHPSRPVLGPAQPPVQWVLRGKLSYLAPRGSEKISAPYFKQCFFRVGGGGITPQAESNTTPPSPKTEITNILFHILYI